MEEFYLLQERRTTDFEAQKFWKGPSGFPKEQMCFRASPAFSHFYYFLFTFFIYLRLLRAYNSGKRWQTLFTVNLTKLFVTLEPKIRPIRVSCEVKKRRSTNFKGLKVVKGSAVRNFRERSASKNWRFILRAKITESCPSSLLCFFFFTSGGFPRLVVLLYYIVVIVIAALKPGRVIGLRDLARVKRGNRGRGGRGRKSCLRFRHGCPTEHFIIKEIRYQAISVSVLHKIRRLSDFEAVKLWNIRSSGCVCPVSIHRRVMPRTLTWKSNQRPHKKNKDLILVAEKGDLIFILLWTFHPKDFPLLSLWILGWKASWKISTERMPCNDKMIGLEPYAEYQVSGLFSMLLSPRTDLFQLHNRRRNNHNSVFVLCLLDYFLSLFIACGVDGPMWIYSAELQVRSTAVYTCTCFSFTPRFIFRALFLFLPLPPLAFGLVLKSRPSSLLVLFFFFLFLFFFFFSFFSCSYFSIRL